MTDLSARITRYAETSRGLISQAGAILLQANDQIEGGTFDFAQWAKSAQQLVNLALDAGMELGPQLLSMAYLAQSSGELEYSDFIEVKPDNECERALSVAASFAQQGAPSWVIPDRTIVFVPGVLRPYATKFRVATSWPDLRSGTYAGRVRLARIKNADPNPAVVDVVVDL